jgi:hypothetical protein
MKEEKEEEKHKGKEDNRILVKLRVIRRVESFQQDENTDQLVT